MTTHFIGIGGIGMSGLARLLLQRGERVSGSDLKSSLLIDQLIAMGATISIGQKAENIKAGMRIVYSSAVTETNPEFTAAKRLGCTLWHRSHLLAHLMEDKRLLAITGSHGKTTTSSLLAWTLQHAGFKPSYAVGGVLGHDGWNAGYGSSDLFVAEADESDASLLNYQPHVAVITNSEPEHLDYYGTFDNLQRTYKKFAESAENVVWCADDANLHALELEGYTYGFQQSDFRIRQFQPGGWDSQFVVEQVGELSLPLPGRHNALNAAAVAAAATQVGVSPVAIRAGFASFPGVGRRCQRRADVGGILMIDDYAHHPTELTAALAGVRQGIGTRRLVAVYQPHRYTRTRDCRGQMGNVFGHADLLFVTEVYSAGQDPIPGITHQCVLDDIKTQHVQFLPRASAAHELVSVLKPGDVVVTLGAGDITSLPNELAKLLEGRHVHA